MVSQEILLAIPVQNNVSKIARDAGLSEMASENGRNSSLVQNCIDFAFFFPMEPQTAAGFELSP